MARTNLHVLMSAVFRRAQSALTMSQSKFSGGSRAKSRGSVKSIRGICLWGRR